MSNAVLISKRSVDINTQTITINFEFGSGSGSDTDIITFTGSKTLEEIVVLINAENILTYQCYIDEDYIKIKALDTNEILSIVISGTELSGILGGPFTVVSGLANTATSATWGGARIPFLFDLVTTNLLRGGIKNRKPFIRKLTGKDYIGKNNTSSSKVIIRKGFNFVLRMDFVQITWLADFLEFSRNEYLKVINGSEYSFDDTDDWELLTETTSKATDVYDIYNVLEMGLGIIKV